METPTIPVRADQTQPVQDTPTFDFRGKHAYLIGIGGCGMSGLARMLKSLGAHVSGSDMYPSDVTDALIADGIHVTFDQPAGNVPENTDITIASAAIHPDHAEYLTATSRGLPCMIYAEALGQCMRHHTGIAIAGTHGKSTTSAMLGVTLAHCGIDPSVIVGATCKQLDPANPASIGFRLGAERIPKGPLANKPGVLIAEACEFNRSFHNLRPTLAAITSVEADHLDIYGSLDAVVQSFREFAMLVPSEADGGRLLIAHEGAHRREVTGGVRCAVETIGYAPSADYQVTYDTSTRRVGLNHRGTHLMNWTINLPGEHMAMNSAVAATLALWAGGDPQRIAEALAGFRGVDRRVQFLGEKRLRAHSSWGNPATLPGVRVYDDYGHHPTEIDATLRALREFERPENRGGRLICVFQPHQHSRTRFLLDEFAQSFSRADIVIVPHIYFVRDSEIEKAKIGASDLVDRLRERGVQAMHLYPFEAIVEQLQNICRPGDLLVVMGAGPVWKVAKGFMEADG